MRVVAVLRINDFALAQFLLKTSAVARSQATGKVLEVHVPHGGVLGRVYWPMVEGAELRY